MLECRELIYSTKKGIGELSRQKKRKNGLKQTTTKERLVAAIVREVTKRMDIILRGLFLEKDSEKNKITHSYTYFGI